MRRKLTKRENNPRPLRILHILLDEHSIADQQLNISKFKS
jgi:hypothetical protein